MLDKLRKPSLVTTDDVGAAFCEILLHPSADSDAEYSEFVSAVHRAVRWRRSSPILVHTAALIVDGPCGTSDVPVDIPLWRSDNGFDVSIVGLMPAEFHEGECAENFRAVYVSIQAECSTSAFKVAIDELRAVLSSSFRSAVEIEQCKINWSIADEVLKSSQVPDDIADRRISLATGTNLMNSFRVIPRCLSEHFRDATKKDSIARRIRNANHLLTEADNQAHSPVGLSLSVAAIESLLCDSGGSDGGIAMQLAEGVATILEPEPNHRMNAVDWVKKLYDIRSKLVHGERIECMANEAKNARLLAAAVLKAVLERREHRSKLGYEDDEKPADLLRELKTQKYLSGQLTGVEDSPVKNLFWRP